MTEDGEMGFFDNLKDALGADKDDAARPPAPSNGDAQLSLPPRHADRDAPAEFPEDSAAATGGKHRA